jgi:5-methyltetrahydropteroyltriglutamate--homocysteine methyltransferase
MDALLDDIGSFPLPPTVTREKFSEAYVASRSALQNGKDLFQDSFTAQNFCDVVLGSFRRKLASGLDVVTFPQHYDGIRQVGDVIHKAMEKGTFVVEDKNAFLPEVQVINAKAKQLSEEFGKKILLRVSLFGPMEQYLKEIGTIPYPDVLEGFAETVRRFAKNSILNTKYIQTAAVSIDEPSFGFLNIAASDEELCAVLEKAYSFQGATRQIHLHSSTKLPDLLCVKNLDVLSFEYAASPKNIEAVTKPMLEKADKRIRVGVSRTDIDAILAEKAEQGIAKPAAEQLVDSEELIQKRFLYAQEKFRDRMTFTGPDCGLGSWPTQEAAQLLLERTVKAVKSAAR